MRGLNHLVLAGRDLDAMGALYAKLGFTLTPRAQHPFGTGNAVIQLRGCYLELLSVTIPQDVPEHGPDSFSFAAFNRDYLARHEGFSMVVFDTPDASADSAAWRAAGLRGYAPFSFSRSARLPDGREVTVGFALAYTSTPQAPWLGHFACQHFMPDYYEQPQYLDHANTAHAVHDVWVSGDGAPGLEGHFAAVTGLTATREGAGRIVFDTRTGRLVLADAAGFRDAFGVEPPHPGDGPHLAGLTIACRTLDPLAGKGLVRAGDRLVLPPADAFGTALAFIEG